MSNTDIFRKLPFDFDESSKKSTIDCAKQLINKRLIDILDQETIREINNIPKNKGGFGQIIEEYVFGREPNNSPKPDFSCGVDCKTTPLKKKGDELVVKERLVCNQINFPTIIDEEWESSSFLNKNSHNLIIRYIDPMDKKIAKTEYLIVDARIFNLRDSEYYEQFKKDWDDIRNLVDAGRAQDLSEKKTMYIGACPKGKNKKDTTSQPNSAVKAMRRAFCFKMSFMKVFLDDYPILR